MHSFSYMYYNQLGVLWHGHTTAMGVLLMSQAITICFITNNMAQNAWYSYILFLVFLGGLLVLFIYLTSVASNELFGGKNYTMSVLGGSALMPTLFVVLVTDPMLFNNSSEDSNSTWSGEDLTMTSMYSYPYMNITVVIILYLLLALLAVVKITESHIGPLRSSS
uniref:NADH-ubiquinone oxidoreductase chain 6 n=1 Tax=Vestalis melania TaxID=1199063 RepID=V9IT52_9ODON|nr:NADH dehydrogenase subunit 6 [Vestalis melania]AFM83576.2 NADH dehydrogenase subunit 6 [Vestalis melania]